MGMLLTLFTNSSLAIKSGMETHQLIFGANDEEKSFITMATCVIY
jgi:hypothetical protein